MKKITTMLAIGALATTLSGCIIVADHDDDRHYRDNWKQRQLENREAISQLQIGATIDSVTERLGGADDSEGFTKGDNKYIVLYYRTRHRHSDGDTSRDETTPLVFENGTLLGWGFAAVDSVRH